MYKFVRAGVFVLVFSTLLMDNPTLFLLTHMPKAKPAHESVPHQ
jgi:hypothetical protein